MIGDIILYLKRVWKEQTCIHHYKSVVRKDNFGIFFHCQKCDKTKTNLP